MRQKTLFLENRAVVNTRPLHQAENLNQLLRALGAHTINFPTLEIKAADISQTKLYCQSLFDFDIAIFTSANAALFSGDYWPQVFPIKNVIAIGTGTQKALKQRGIFHNILPRHFSSEGILALPELNDIQDKKIIIFCGKKPKPLLSTNLSQRGASVTQCECYQRVHPNPDKKLLESWVNEKIHSIISTSSDSLTHLNTLITDYTSIKKIPLVVISLSMENLARSQGWESIFVSPMASDEAIVETLMLV